jgi:hypothetical protein
MTLKKRISNMVTTENMPCLLQYQHKLNTSSAQKHDRRITISITIRYCVLEHLTKVCDKAKGCMHALIRHEPRSCHSHST